MDAVVGRRKSFGFGWFEAWAWAMKKLVVPAERMHGQQSPMKAAFGNSFRSDAAFPDGISSSSWLFFSAC